MIADEKGQVMAGLEEAVEAAAAIARDALPRRKTRTVTVEVSNAHHEPVLSVTISMEVKRY